MTSRERTLKAIRHEKPDRPPVYFPLTPQVAEKLAKHFGIALEKTLPSRLSNHISWHELISLLGSDIIAISYCYAENKPIHITPEGLLVNEWGMIYKDTGLYSEFYDFPLKHAESVNDILDYSFPDPFAKGRFDEAKLAISKYGKSHAIMGDVEMTIFETCWYLTGLEKFLMDLIIEPPYLQELIDRVMLVNLELAKQLVNLGVDIIWLGDDFGIQTGMIMNPEIWRKHFKSRMQYFFSELKKLNPDVKIAWHTCGSIVPIVPDFIEIGLDILNPLQPLAHGMDPAFFKKTWGKQLTFFGAIDVQQLLPFESPHTVKSEVKRIASILGEDGGYIIAPAHNIQIDTPVENILAIYEAVKEL
jgi:uroporphyrinogen decarboxylase